MRRNGWTLGDDQGVTLPELLIAIAILSVIITPLANAMTAYLRNTDDTIRQLGESHDVQIVAAYFARDVQSLGVRDANFALRPSVNNTTNFPCNGTGTSVVLLAWDGIHPTSGMPTTVRVNYVVRDVAGEHQLRRLTCYGNATVVSDLVMVHNLVGDTLTYARVLETSGPDQSVHRLRRATADHAHHVHRASPDNRGHIDPPHTYRPAETVMTPKRFCIRPGDDRGASLVLALVFVTVVSLVIMATLTFADTSMRATIALRGNVAQTAAAQGAAQVAINELRTSTYVGTDGNCFGAAGAAL